jgi:hypothetical protein
MTLNNSMSITPSPPGQAKGAKFEHGSVLGGKTRGARVSSQWKSTSQDRFLETATLLPFRARSALYAIRIKYVALCVSRAGTAYWLVSMNGSAIRTR